MKEAYSTPCPKLFKVNYKSSIYLEQTYSASKVIQSKLYIDYYIQFDSYEGDLQYSTSKIIQSKLCTIIYIVGCPEFELFSTLSSAVYVLLYDKITYAKSQLSILKIHWSA